MNNFGGSVIKGGKKAVGAVAKIIRDESLETLKTTARQVIPEGYPASLHYAGGRAVARGLSETGYSAERHEAETKLKLESLRRQLKSIREEELKRARRMREEGNRAWEKRQEEMTEKGSGRADVFVPPEGKKRKGFMRGRKVAAQIKSQNIETGKGAKN